MTPRTVLRYLRKSWLEGVDSVPEVAKATEFLKHVLQVRGKRRRDAFGPRDIYAHAVASAFCDYLGRYKDAEALLKPLQDAVRQLPTLKLSVVVTVCAAVGRSRYRARKFDDALRIMTAGLEVAERSGDLVSLGLLRFECARVLARLRRSAEARRMTQDAMEAFREARSAAGATSDSRTCYRIGLCRFLLASIAYRDSQLSEAKGLLLEASDLLPVGDWIHRGRIDELKGRISRAQSRTDLAQKEFEAAIELLDASRHHPYLASAHKDLAHLFTRTRDFANAAKALVKSERLDASPASQAKGLYFHSRYFLHAHNCAESVPLLDGCANALECAEQLAAAALKLAHTHQNLSLQAQLWITKARIHLVKQPLNLKNVWQAALKAKAFNSDEQGRDISKPLEIAFSLVMAGSNLVGPMPDLGIAGAYLRVADHLLKVAPNAFLEGWSRDLKEQSRTVDPSVFLKWGQDTPTAGLEAREVLERCKFQMLRNFAGRHRTGRRKACDLVATAHEMGYGGATTLDRWLKNWRRDEKGKRAAIGVTEHVLEDLLGGVGLGRGGLVLRDGSPRRSSSLTADPTSQESEDDDDES
jgi:tetratricopeptide (TPR) repeat protein